MSVSLFYSYCFSIISLFLSLSLPPPGPTDSNTNDVINRLLTIMLEAMVPPSTSASQGGGGGATTKEATPIPLKALNLIAMHPKIRLMEMVKVQEKLLHV